MLTGITGTPGCGKTTVAETLRNRGVQILDLKTTVSPFVIGNEDESDIIDTDG
ncbi:MAG: dephospho-CoA kinase, partial [Methanocorpusculum sp.]|nr:dephospho-CoA kinase [Candidatus Methanocorpusculum equi]